MKPYYQDDAVVIYLGDCREILPEIDTGSVDLVLTDPPYNAGIDYGPLVDDKLKDDKYSELMASVISECERISSGLVAVFSSVSSMWLLPRPRWTCVWMKPMSFSHRVGGSPFLPHWEPCLMYGKPWGEGGRVPNYSFSDVWQSNPAKRNGHPCPKPEQLIRKILSVIPGDSVLDPFMGSGTTLRAAKDLGRKAIGIEIEEKYCEIAAKRMSQLVMNL